MRYGGALGGRDLADQLHGTAHFRRHLVDGTALGSGTELWLVGYDEYGDDEIFGLIEALAGDPIAMYTISRRLDELGSVSMSARAGQRLLRVLNTNPNAGLPKPLLALSYPAAFAPLVQQAAFEQGVAPLLMLAFIRQESFFDPRAVSPADARGLTQVIPPTAQAIASTLDVTGFSLEQLLHADLNLQFGAKYMADQLNAFNGELFVAFAAYNAGPTAAFGWRDVSGDDADLFLQTVEFSETQLYVEIGLVLPLLAISCSGDEEPKDEASGNTPAPIVTRAPQGETPPALEPVNSANPTSQPLPSATSVPISPAGPGDGPPISTASAGGMAVEMGIGTYCWSNLCVDKIGPVTRGTLEIASGDEIVVAVPAGPALSTAKVTAFLAGESMDLGNGEMAWQLDFDASVPLTSQRVGDEVKIEGGLPAGTYVHLHRRYVFRFRRRAVWSRARSAVDCFT